MQKLLLFVVLCVAFASCGPQIYKAASFQEVSSAHKVVAIMPFDVLIESRKLPKGVTADMILDQQRDYGYGIQNDVYGYFLRQMSKNRYTVTFQDVHKTNSLLEEAGITYEDLRRASKEQICQLLGVDAVVSGSATMSKPMSDGAAVAVGLLVGAWGPTNSVNTTITIHEGAKGELMWKYDYAASGSIGSSRQSLTNALMRNSSKKFPYQRKS
ncbi:hypothetical protein CLV24_1111 [Pontibacter ummariensis]|uniref:Lipoprotein n=1 Tax=Pontibacter ummariensis TaxID=1610492 RepID=A0A239GE84_9BACT|nr:hypothetical protein [Pontibacter ummariensis]PRY11206.1 hypothetical protein CLV24_1111 [Pontibacter ummariensis]SNS67068.1 hypothetical protein SAMN06296052_1111 [Pontibacter ummariensis]